MDFSFIHVADIHLGRPFSDLSKYSYDDRVKEIYKSAVETTFNNIIDFAISKKVDFVFIAGDTFDSGEQDFSSKLLLKEKLRQLEAAEIRVYLICGNHDPVYSYNKSTFNFDENSKIKIIGLNTPPYCELPLILKNGEKAGILRALSYTEEKFNKNPLELFTQIKPDDKNLFNIGLLHCDLNADNSSPYAPCSLSGLKSFNYDYWALGHIHIPSADNDGNIQYSGTIQGRNTKETGRHGIRYVKIENNNIIGNEFINVDVVRFEDIECDISEAKSSIEAVEIIKEKITEISNSAQLYLIRLNLLGCIEFYSEIDDEFFEVLSEKIKNEFFQKVYISQIKNLTIPKIDEALFEADDGILGEIYKTVNNETVVQNNFICIENSLKSIISECNFKQAEYDNFIQAAKKTAKDECINLCNVIYNSESKED